MADQPVRKGRGTLSVERLKMAQQMKAQGKGRAQGLKKLQEMVDNKQLGAAAASSSASSSVTVPPSEKLLARDEGDVKRTPDKNIEQITKATAQIELEEPSEPCYFRGQSGTPLNVSVNYVKLNIEKDKGVYEYEVKFVPPVDAISNRRKLLSQLLADLSSVKVFDGGCCLYLPVQIIKTEQVFTGKLPHTNDEIKTTLIFKRKKKLSDCLHLYNVLFKRIMYILMYQPMGPHGFFDVSHKEVIPQHKLEVYPGYAISIDEVENGLMICLDTQHRVIRSQTVFQLLNELYAVNARNFKEFATRDIVGMVVLTEYNNKTYRIDDIAWDMTPKNTFPTRDGSLISFVDYYKKNYNKTISDMDQPLLLHKKNITVQGEGGALEKKEQMICLIPEFCALTGLSDAMRSDFKVMKDVAMYTRVTPNQRMQAMSAFLRKVEHSDEAQAVLRNWGLSIDSAATKLQARNLDKETILFGSNRSYCCAATADWSRPMIDNQLIGPVDIKNWVLYHTPRDKRFAQTFCETIVRMARPMGCIIKDPKMIELPDDRTDSYRNACNQLTKDVDVAVFICPTIRTDRYAVIKKICCTQTAIASQVILSKTLSNPAKLRTIVHKIAAQITCKMGGALWSVNLPFNGWMICGIDVYHGGPQNSVCGFVSSTNAKLTKWFSKPLFQEREIGDFYKVAFANGLKEYRKESGTYPLRVIVFRDGVSDGQLSHCKAYEIKQFEDVIREFDAAITLTYIIVQKRISTRIYAMGNDGASNPLPGTVLDSAVTRTTLSDFFLIPQNVRQGTVNPTHYIVLHDTANLKPDHVQRLAYKLCHLYYNWSGTIRVPAPCMYAHKLAALVGQVLKKTPLTELDNRLYYL